MDESPLGKNPAVVVVVRAIQQAGTVAPGTVVEILSLILILFTVYHENEIKPLISVELHQGKQNHCPLDKMQNKL